MDDGWMDGIGDEAERSWTRMVPPVSNGSELVKLGVEGSFYVTVMITMIMHYRASGTRTLDLCCFPRPHPLLCLKPRQLLVLYSYDQASVWAAKL